MIGIAIGGGLFTGFLVWLLGFISKIEPADYYNDRTFWQLPTDYEYVVDKDEDYSESGNIPIPNPLLLLSCFNFAINLFFFFFIRFS